MVLAQYRTCPFYLPPSSDCDAVIQTVLKSVLMGQRTEFLAHILVLALKLSAPLTPFILIYLCFAPVWYLLELFIYDIISSKAKLMLGKWSLYGVLSLGKCLFNTFSSAHQTSV